MGLCDGLMMMWLSLVNIGMTFGCCFERTSTVQKQKSLFVFGDSLFDPGNNNYINTTTQFQANWWPYGESFFHPPTGRFCDGRIIPDFIGNEYLCVNMNIIILWNNDIGFCCV